MATGSGKGNHRKGIVRGRPMKPGQTLPWREDMLILKRVELGATLHNQPQLVALEAVNKWLKSQGEDGISLATLKLDRKRARELMQERIAYNMDEQIAHFWSMYEEARRRAGRIQEGHGQSWAATMAIAVRAIEDVAKLTGTWNRVPESADGTPVVGKLGMSPRQQLEAGLITQEQYDAAMSVFLGSVAPSLPGEVVDAEFREVEPRGTGTGDSSPRVNRPGGHDSPRPMKGADTDDLPLVYDWSPEDE